MRAQQDTAPLWEDSFDDSKEARKTSGGGTGTASGGSHFSQGVRLRQRGVHTAKRIASKRSIARKSSIGARTTRNVSNF